MRFIKVFGLLAVLAAVLATTASAGGYTDASYITPTGYVGKPYHHKISWKPGTGCPPWKYRFSSGELPPGLTVHTDGTIDGTPTSAGDYTFYVQMFDQCGVEGEGNAPFKISIRPGLTVMAPPSLPIATNGVAYTYQLPVNGSGPYTWSLASGTLPAGLALSNDGVISGTPTAIGSANFTVQVTNGSLTDTKNVTLNVVAPLTATAQRVTGAEVGVAYTQNVVAAGGTAPYTWGATPTGLPAGLTFSNGVISGTPAAAGRYTVTVTVVDANGTSTPSQVFITVQKRLTIDTRSLRTATAGHAYRGQVVISGGVVPARWSLSGGRLPVGMHLNTRTGRLTGAPHAAGTARFRISVKDVLGVTATRSFKLVIH